MATRDEARQMVIAYIQQNRTRLILFSVSSTVLEIRTAVVGARMLSEEEIRSLVNDWLSLNVPGGPMNTTPHPASVDGRIVQAVKSALTTVTDGEDIITYRNGKINVGVTGLTADLKKGDQSLSVGVSWGGKLAVETDTGDFHLSGELSSTRWSLSISYPDDTSIPDLSKLGEVFRKGEASMRGILGATSGFKNLSDFSKVQAAIKPFVQPISDAVDAVQGIAKAPPKGGFSVGFSLNSPDPFPGQNGMPGGIEGQVTFTYRF